MSKPCFPNPEADKCGSCIHFRRDKDSQAFGWCHQYSRRLPSGMTPSVGATTHTCEHHCYGLPMLTPGGGVVIV